MRTRLLYISLLLLAIAVAAPATGEARPEKGHGGNHPRAGEGHHTRKGHSKHRRHRSRRHHHRRPHRKTTRRNPRLGAPAPSPVSAWDRPTLTDPATAAIDAQHTTLVLDTARDYVITLGASADSLPKGVSISGGHNVVIDGGRLNITGASGGLTLKNQTGTIWIHNVHIAGPQLLEGIDLDERQPNATVVLRNVLIDTVHGSSDTNHADLIQTWAGPSRLLIDGLTGSTDYQGFFLLPRQQFASGAWPKLFDFRHVDIDNNGGYALWRDPGNPYPQYVQDVYVTPNPAKPSRDSWLWPKPSTGDVSWPAVNGFAPPGGSFVHATATGAAGRADLPAPAPKSGEEANP